MYFEVTYKASVNGEAKKGMYVVNTETFGDAEKKVYEEEMQFSQELAISSVKKTKYAHICMGESDMWYKVKVDFKFVDEKTGKEKVNRCEYLVNSDTMEEAKKKISEFLKDTMMDFVVSAIYERKTDGIL